MEKELERLFRKEQSRKTYETAVDRIISSAEEEFKSYSQEGKSRKEEEEELQKKIKNLNIQLKKHANIKNHRMREMNAERSKKRKEIRKEIEFCYLRLREIGEECQ